MTVDVNEKAIVVICGPVVSGKTSIARKLLRDNGGKYISYEKIWNELPKNWPKERKMLAQTKSVWRAIQKSVDEERYTVIETPFVTNQQLLTLITCIRICGYKPQLTLLKVFLDEALHMDYWKRKKGQKPSKRVLREERKKFQEVLAEDYSNTSKEYVITNPEDVKYKFS